MSSQTKLIKDILSLYNTILENKNISEATDVYDNVEFKNSNLGNPSSDNINTALLQDVQTAAKTAGVNVTITTAISGHRPSPRHDSGNAVDIAIINGKAVSPSNRADADKLVNALVSMGYTKNVESSNDKAVLTFGFEGHDNHVHVSNKTNTPSNNPKTSSDTTSSGDTSTTTTTGGSFAREIGKSILNAVGVNEEKVYGSFGDNIQSRYGSFVIPKDNNSKIKSPVDGKITSYYNSNCDNQVVIEFENNDKVAYLEYCGISTPLVQDGQTVNKGTTIGRTDSDVKVTLYDSNKNRDDINTEAEKNSKNLKNKKPKNGEDDNDDLYGKNEYSKLFINSYRSLKNSFKKKDPKKIEENINRIKGLLK
jgi:biotin carboxyl carrier protein